MIKYIKASKDSSIDELNPIANYGLNNTLFLKKETRNADQHYNSRLLIQFNLNEVINAINNDQFIDPTYYLKVYSVESYNIDFINDIEIYPVSQSWENGTGVNSGDPYLQSDAGVSWKFRENVDESNTTWSFSNLEPDVTYSYQTNEGGGNWYNNYAASQSFNYYAETVNNLDIRSDVSDIIDAWVSGSINNNGFIIKRSDEQESDYKNYKEISFFSKDTNTIYYPVIEIVDDDSVYNTGSIEKIDLLNYSYRLYSNNLKNSFYKKETDRIIVNCNKMYESQSYESELTSSLNNKELTSQSYYEVIRADTGEVIIPKSKGTKISIDNNQNFFVFDFKNLFRHYNYKFRYIVEQGDLVKYYDDNKIFTVK